MLIHPEFVDPPREFSLCPFWFWNDALDEAEIVRQMDDFQAHGVHAFVIHPRVGLPRSIGWMSDEMGHFVRFAVAEAKRRDMWVVLYDEGMYPSGSSSGQVVAENPDFQCRGLTRLGDEVIEGPMDSCIRGLHYVGEGPEEDEPPAADLLNPEAVRCFIRLVYERYRTWVGEFFGTTVRGIFTDEPSLLGRPRGKGHLPGTCDIFEHVERLTGADLSGRKLELWEDGSEARRLYDRGVRLRLEETYYAPLAEWCGANGLALMGHPEPPDDPSPLRFFDVPGQDLVWRWVLPGATAIEGPQSVQAKAAASAMKHAGKRRNSNELCGAYGHELTFEEFKWLVDWCAVRGTNLFFPHAFYYSVRGIRWDERPPDVGPNSAWWNDFAVFGQYCARLAWLNTDSEHVCQVAILERDGIFPWETAKTLLESQIDFDYLSHQDLSAWRSHYEMVIEDTVPPNLPRTLAIQSHPNLRVRHIRKADQDIYILHNEGPEAIGLNLPGRYRRIDPMTMIEDSASETLTLSPFELTLLQG